MALYTDNIKGQAYNSIQERAILTLADSVERALSKTNVDPGPYNTIQNILSKLRRNVRKLLINGAELIETIESIFENSINIGATDFDSYNFHANLFGLNIAPGFSIINSARELTYINLILVTQSVNIYALSNSLVNISQVAFSNSEEIESILSTISTQYTGIIARNRFTKLDQEQIELVTIDAQLSDQVSNTISFLQDAEISLPKQQTIEVTRSSLLALTYRYYGDIELRNTLADINGLGSPLNIVGLFKVLAT